MERLNKLPISSAENINPNIKYVTLDTLTPDKPLLIAMAFPGHLASDACRHTFNIGFAPVNPTIEIKTLLLCFELCKQFLIIIYGKKIVYRQT